LSVVLGAGITLLSLMIDGTDRMDGQILYFRFSFTRIVGNSYVGVTSGGSLPRIFCDRFTQADLALRLPVTISASWHPDQFRVAIGVDD
jgi:hypothetical protein